MSASKISAMLEYVCHGLAAHDVGFVRSKLAAQVRAGNIIVLPLSCVWDLPSLWISLVDVIPQAERRPRLIYDYSFFGLNSAVAPTKAMQFGCAFDRLLHQILVELAKLRPVHLSKVDFSGAYMCIWVWSKDLLRLAFIVPPHSAELDPLIGFHLLLPMGYVDSAAHFCCTAKTVADIANTS